MNNFFLFFLIVTLVRASFWDRFFDPRLSRAPKFEGDRFFRLDSYVNLDKMEGSIECFGDFNSDRYTDIFVLAKNRSTVTIHLWDTDVWKFVEKSSFDVADDLLVDGLAATDFNRDGSLDLLVQGHYLDTPHLNVVQLYIGNYESLAYEVTLTNNTVHQVLILDFNADLHPDLLGEFYDEELGTVQRLVLLNNVTRPGEFDVVNVTDVFGTSSNSSNFGSSAFVDLDGDCLADLVLASVNPDGKLVYSFYMNGKGEFTKNETGIATVEGSGHLTFADFDGDGAVDILFPVCYPPGTCAQENSIHIIYNQQETICQSFFARNCRADSDLCSHRDFVFSDFNAPPSSGVVHIPKATFGGSHFHVSPRAPYLKIRSGDFNLDGYPDIVFFSMSEKNTNGSKIEVWTSVPCTATTCHADAVSLGRRTFTPLAAETQGYISQIYGGYAGAFFDFDEDGSNDMIFLAENPTNGSLTLHGAFNNLNNDAYFFKTLALNGLCTQWCDGAVVPDPKPYGVNQYGATMKFSLSDMTGTRRANAVPQLSQTGYLPLQTPYTLNGLGRPANYIDYLYVGVPIYTPGSPHYNVWPALIPNSQIVAIPYPPNDPAKYVFSHPPAAPSCVVPLVSPGLTPPSWMPELYITPSGSILWIIIAAITSSIGFGIIVIVLTVHEHKQDEQEIKDTQHLFSFSYFS